MENLNIEKLGTALITKTKTSVRWKSIAPTLLLIWIVGMIDKIGVAVIATNKTFLSDMNLVGNHTLVGSLVTALLFSYGIGFFIWGWLVDRYGPKKCALFGLVLWGLSTALAAIAPSFQVLFISRIILGFSEACLWPISNSLTARWFPLSERGSAKSIWVNGTNIGPAISGFVVTFLIQQFQWRGVFWFLTFAALAICIPVIYFFIKDDPANDKRVSREELEHIRSEQIEGDKDNHIKKKNNFHFSLVILGFTATVFGVYGLGTWFPSYLSIAKHLSPASSNSYILLAYTLAIALTLFVGKIIDKTNKKAIWNIVAFALAAILLYVGQQFSSAIVNVLFVTAAICMISGITTLIGHGLLHSMSPTNRMGTDAGIMTGVSNVLGAFGPMIMGALITLGSGQYQYAFYFLIAIFLVAFASSLFLYRKGY